MSKRKKVMVILFMVTVAVMLSGCSFQYGFRTANELKRGDSKDFILEKSKVDQINEIEVHTRMADIELIPADDFYVEIEYTYWEDEPEYTLENGVLTFDDWPCMPDTYSLRYSLKNYIKIYIPEETLLDQIKLDTASGNVSAEGFISDKLEIIVSYGDLDLTNASALDADIRLSSGRSKIKDFNAGELEFGNSYGKADFININMGGIPLLGDGVYESINITMSSGNCILTGVTSRTIYINDSYGDVTCEDVLSEELDVTLSSGDLEILKAEVEEIDVTDSYGDVSLSLLGSEEDYSLDLDTSYGDIEIAGDTFDEHVKRNNNGNRSVSANLSSGNIEINFK